MSSLSLSLPRHSFSKLALVAALILACLLVFGLLRLMGPRQATEATLVAPTAVPARQTNALTADKLRQPLPTITNLNDRPAAVVAQVNGVPLSLARLTQAAKVELAIGALLAQPVVAAPVRQLDQLINGEVVLQAAHAAAFTLSAQEEAAALDAWLAQQELDRTALVAALATVELTLADFQAEFARLVTIDRFVSQQLVATGLDRASLLRQWQAAAQISVGPAAPVAYNAAASAERVDQVPTARAVVTPLPTLIAAAPTLATAPIAAAPERIGPFTLWSPTQLNSGAKPALLPTARPTAGTGPAPIIGLAPGNLAPTFTLPLLATTQPAVNLADWRGQPVVLSFWTTWCPYCRKQTPVLVAGANNAAAGSVQFVGINVAEAASTVEPYVAEHQMPYPVLLDTTGQVAEKYLVRGYPTTYFLDGEGYIVAKHVGVLAANQLAGYLSQLAERASPIR